MSYLKQAAAIAGLTIVTATASAQTGGSQQNNSNSAADASARAAANATAKSGRGGNATVVRPNAQLEGSVSNDGDFKVRINEGPMAGQTLTINPKKETYSVTTYPHHSPAVTVAGNLGTPANQKPYQIGLLLDATYQTKTGDIDATCTVSKDSSKFTIKDNKPSLSPEAISYTFNCKTQFGAAAVIVTPHNNQGTYLYNSQTIIKSDPETGKVTNIQTPWPQTDITFKPSQP